MRMNATQFTAYVRNPARMPPYSTKVLTDAQVTDIYAYIQTPGGDFDALRLTAVSIAISMMALIVSEVLARRLNQRAAGFT